MRPLKRLNPKPLNPKRGYTWLFCGFPYQPGPVVIAVEGSGFRVKVLGFRFDGLRFGVSCPRNFNARVYLLVVSRDSGKIIPR